MCHTGRRFRAAVAASSSSSGLQLEDDTLDIRRVVERSDGTFSDGDWYESQLLSFLL